MARIVYGVAGEGSGHSSRARRIAGHLRERGHTLRLVSYDRGYRNLKDDFDVLEVEGLCIASADNKVSAVRTFTENIQRLPEGYRSLHDLRRLFKEFQPDCVITDFEPMTAHLANHYALPLVTVDNQHRMRYLEYDCPPGLAGDARMTKTIIRAMVPRPDVSLVTAFHPGRPTNDRTFVFPSILRREVLDLRPVHGDHVLVYLTSGFESFLDELPAFDRESFLVYGCDRSDREGPLTFRPFSRDGFLRDLAGAKVAKRTLGWVSPSPPNRDKGRYAWVSFPSTRPTRRPIAMGRTNLLRPGGTTANSQGRQPLDPGWRGTRASQRRHETPVAAAGLPHSRVTRYLGLTSWAIDLRPSGA